MINFKNKKILVLGGSGLIGKSLISKLLKNGAHVINVDFVNLKIKKKKYKFYNLDVTKNDFIEKLKYKNKNLDIDILINCSYPRTKNWSKNDFKNFNEFDFLNNLKLNSSSYFILTKKFADLMKNRKKGGSIILVSSIYGFLAHNMNLYKNTEKRENITYAIVKGALINFVKELASYYAKYNIRINAVSPGGIKDKTMSKKFINKYSNLCPSKRMAHQDEVSSAICFLASDLSGYINGHNLIVDGGYSII